MAAPMWVKFSSVTAGAAGGTFVVDWFMGSSTPGTVLTDVYGFDIVNDKANLQTVQNWLVERSAQVFDAYNSGTAILSWSAGYTGSRKQVP